MKIGISTAVLLIALGNITSVQAQGKPAGPPALVKVSGTFSAITILSVNNNSVTVVIAKLAGDVAVHIQVPKVIAGNDLVDFFKRGLDKGVYSEGTLKLEGKKLVLSGEARIRGDPGTDKELAKGAAIVEGEAVQGKYSYGKGEKSNLAIKNGSGIIVVAGKLPKEQAELQGRIRVTGNLQVNDNGTVLITPTKVDSVKKK